jgi:hypothetical protein
MSAPNTPETNPAETVGHTWSERNYRALKISVIVMGILIVLGLIVVLATIVKRVANSGSPEETAPIATALPPDIATILDTDGEVVSTALDGSRLAIVFKRPDGHAVLVVDLRTGRVLNVISGETAR